MGFDGDAQSVSLPTTEGSVGILAHHSNIIMAVVPGEITYRAADGSEETVIVSDGLLKVENGEAWVSEANCPDKVCMGMGKISRNGEFIACLPNRLLVVVEGAAEDSPVDGMT